MSMQGIWLVFELTSSAHMLTALLTADRVLVTAGATFVIFGVAPFAPPQAICKVIWVKVDSLVLGTFKDSVLVTESQAFPPWN